MKFLVMSTEVDTSLDSAPELAADLIHSLPIRSASGLAVYVAASTAAAFSTSFGMTER